MHQLAQIGHLLVQGLVEQMEVELVVVAPFGLDVFDKGEEPFAEDVLELVAHPFRRPEPVVVGTGDVLIERIEPTDLREVLVEVHELVDVGEVDLDRTDDVAFGVFLREALGAGGPHGDPVREHGVAHIGK